MKVLRLVVCWLLIWGALVCHTQDRSQSDIAYSMRGRTVFLRGMELGDQLNFDAHGEASETYQTGMFGLSAINVLDVNLSADEVNIWGQRMEPAFAESAAHTFKNLRYVPTGKYVNVTIALDSRDPEALKRAVEKVFALSPEDDLSSRSAAEQQVELDGLGVAPNTVSFQGQGVLRPGGGVSAPRAINAPDPEYTVEAAEKHIEGICIIGMVVGVDGIPTQVHVVRSFYPGLDAKAVEAARKYRFFPSTFRGRPVPVWINIEMNFHIKPNHK